MSANYFDYEAVKTKTDALSIIFNDFNEKIIALDTTIDTNFYGDDPASKGDPTTAALLSNWEQYFEGFKDFKQAFDELVAGINQTSTNNTEFEDTAATYSKEAVDKLTFMETKL